MTGYLYSKSARAIIKGWITGDTQWSMKLELLFTLMIEFWISIFFSIVFCEVFAIISRKNVREMLVQKKII